MRKLSSAADAAAIEACSGFRLVSPSLLRGLLSVALALPLLGVVMSSDASAQQPQPGPFGPQPQPGAPAAQPGAPGAQPGPFGPQPPPGGGQQPGFGPAPGGPAP